MELHPARPIADDRLPGGLAVLGACGAVLSPRWRSRARHQRGARSVPSQPLPHVSGDDSAL
eukprot:13978995-Alexandrium_andersonii.AAC.1